MDSIKRISIQNKIDLVYQLTRDIGDRFEKQESKQEDIFIQIAHHLFDGTKYTADGIIPSNVINGMGDVFRRYGHHLSELIEYHRQLDPDYFVLYLAKFLDFDECQSKLNENAYLSNSTNHQDPDHLKNHVTIAVIDINNVLINVVNYLLLFELMHHICVMTVKKKKNN
eukprot:92666_1